MAFLLLHNYMDFIVLGGLGLFLYGMTMMSAGLQKTAGNELKKIIEILTTNIYMGILVGTLVTVLIQSSSGTTVMVIGFVNAGIMSLTQAAGVIMGANIGTTITGQLIAVFCNREVHSFATKSTQCCHPIFSI